MLCIHCSTKTRIYNSRSSHQKSQTWRRHRCPNCNVTFTTREKVDYSGLIQVSDGGNHHPYSPERLLLSILRASDKIPLPTGMAIELTDSIEQALQQEAFFAASPQDKILISEQALVVLKRYNKNLALQYLNQVYKNQPPTELITQLMTE